jgi:hypothetical protein
VLVFIDIFVFIGLVVVCWGLNTSAAAVNAFVNAPNKPPSEFAGSV